MMQLEDQLRAYAGDLVDPGALGPDPGDPDGPVSPSVERPGWSRRVLVAALVVLVVGIGGAIVVARDRSAPEQWADAITVTGASAEFELTVTVSDPSPAFGTNLGVEVVARNVSSERLLVNAGFAVITLANLPPPTIPSDGSYRSMIWSSVSTVGAEPADPTEDPQRAVAIAVGESRTFRTVVPIDDRVGAGPSRLDVAPCLRNSEDLELGGSCPGPVVTVLIEVGEPADGQVTRPQALLDVLSTPRVQEWVAAIGLGGDNASTTAVLRRGEGWRVVTGAIEFAGVHHEEAAESEVRAFGGPAVIADVSSDGRVSIHWLVMPD